MQKDKAGIAHISFDLKANYRSIFTTYLELGLRHITDPRAYDHMLFLLTLVLPYQLKQWRGLILPATGFTLGHSGSMALSLWQLGRTPSAYVEFAIPFTILISAIITATHAWSANNGPIRRGHFWLVMAFGLVHGLGFSNFLQAVLPPGIPTIWPLLAFNLGVECGQLAFMAIVLFASYLMYRFTPIKTQHAVVFAMFVTAALSILLIFENKFW
ncbi:MAG: HupE/UreJ family protein [Bacteroidetes bacterium]|jgi:hypothetical protein|nr:HupE/UreJ family protein [Bacteroidota bacterium]